MPDTTLSSRPSERSDRLATVALSLAALFWSGNFVAGRFLRDAVDPVSLNTIRWGVSLLVFLPFVLPAVLRHRAAVRRNWRLLAMLGLTGIAAFQTTVYTAMTLTTATNGLLVLALAPIAILIASALIGDTRPTRLQWVGSALSLAGVFVLITRADPVVLRTLSFNAGDLWILAGVLIWTVYSLLLRRRPPELPQNVTLAVSMAVGLSLMFLLSLAMAPSLHVALDGPAMVALAYVSVVPSLLSFLLWSWGVSRVGPERAGQYIHLMPVFGPILAMLILGERIEPVQGLGAVIVFSGIALVVRSGR